VLANGASQADKDRAAVFVRSRLTERNGQTYVEVPADQPSYRLGGMAVSARAETAYAAAALLATKDASDLPLAIAATNYLTGQMNEEGRLYCTIDTAACLALMLALSDSGLVTTASPGRGAAAHQ